MTISTSTKLEAVAALAGAALGAVGAVLVEPLILGIGAFLAAFATVMRISERDKKTNQSNQDRDHTDTHRVAV